MIERADPAHLPQVAGEDALLPIREVVRLTGINPVTLRAWERRYGLIQPVRTDGGHRLYSQQDVATIRNVQLWTGRGVAVSKVGDILARDGATAALLGGPPSSAGHRADDLEWDEWQQVLQQALQHFDTSRLEQVYGQVFSLYPLPVVFENVLLPVWHRLRLDSSFGRLSQWLLLDAFLRGRVIQRLQAARAPGEGSVLLAALPGQCHELELLVAGLLLAGDQGAVRILALGQPVEELPLVCEALRPSGLVLYTAAAPTTAMLRQVGKLVLAIDCPLALAGAGAELVQEQLQGSPVANLGGAALLMRRRLTQFLTGHLDT